MFRESNLTLKPYEKLGTSERVFIVFGDNVYSVVRMKMITAVTHKLCPFGVATTHHGGRCNTYGILEIFEEKKRVGIWKLAVCTGALVKFPGANMEVMQVDSGGRPHISICMMILGLPRKLKTRVFVKLLSCTESGTNGTEVVRGCRR